MSKKLPLYFYALQLNEFSDEGWAVVEHPSGAIVLDRYGNLIIKLTREQAERIAQALSKHGQDGFAVI